MNRATPPRGSDPRQAAFEILRRVESGGAYASVLLERAEARLPDPRDGALLHELVLGVLRNRAVLDHALSLVASRPIDELDPPVREALRIGAYALLFLDRVPDFAAVDTAVTLVLRNGPRRSAGFVNAVLRNTARRGRELLPQEPAAGDIPSLARFASHPEWWVRRVVERVGWDAARRLLEANNRPAATVLRPNLRRTTPRDLALRLAREGVVAEPCRHVPEALRVVSGRAQHTSTFRDGYAWIQDEASQLVVQVLGRVFGPRVADLCAAPGAKTMMLAEGLPRGGLLVAADRSTSRLRLLAQNVERLGVADVARIAADASAQPFLRTELEHVLVDAPCSGSGTLRRHPEIRWRFTPERIALLSAQQGRILDHAARIVAPGGTILYSVCSVEPEEGEEVVASFLARHPELVRTPARLSGPARELVDKEGALRTSPLVDGMDGFYAVAMTRAAAGVEAKMLPRSASRSE